MSASSDDKASIAAATASLAREAREAVPSETSGFFFEEEVTPDLAYKMRLRSITYNGESKFQQVQIINTDAFGQTLVLDSKTQSAQFDEAVRKGQIVFEVDC